MTQFEGQAFWLAPQLTDLFLRGAVTPFRHVFNYSRLRVFASVFYSLQLARLGIAPNLKAFRHLGTSVPRRITGRESGHTSGQCVNAVHHLPLDLETQECVIWRGRKSPVPVRDLFYHKAPLAKVEPFPSTTDGRLYLRRIG